MMTKTRVFWSSLLLATLSLATVQAALPVSVGDRPVTSLAPLVERVSPAVVNIRVSQTVSRRNPFGDDAFRRFFGIPDAPSGERQVSSAGSGVIVDAEVVGSDPATDIAVIKVEAEGLVEMPIGDSEGARVGDFVIAIGNPFGLGHTVTSGIISALGRTGISRDGYEDFIQTDASINPGNSGGALVNMEGELIGINSAIISRSGGNVGIGFAVPTEIAGSIMNQILDFGEIRRGLLGVRIQTIDAEMADALSTNVKSGALITNIEPNSAAEEAGLEVGDIIVAVNEKKVDDAAGLRNTIGLLRSGDDVEIEYVRDSKKSMTTAQLGQQQTVASTGAELHPGLSGARFAPSSATSDGGVEVTEVEPGSPAAQRGLRAGDVITAVNRSVVRSLEDLAAIAANNRILFLLVQRGDRSLMLQIR